jgi:hypothetical protein
LQQLGRGNTARAERLWIDARTYRTVQGQAGAKAPGW